MQVMVMDPNLIVQCVNVVIGEGLYELNFKVEGTSADSNAQPMNMDSFQSEGGGGSKDAGNLKNDKQQSVHGSSLGCSSQGAGHKVDTFILNV
jgi:hypothetical protein